MTKTFKNILFLMVVAILSLSTKPGFATVQSFSKAKSMEIFAPADTVNSGRTASSYRTVEDIEKKAIAQRQKQSVENQDEYIAVNYNRIIAQKLLSKANDNVYVGTNSRKRKISVPLGKDLTIKLIEENNQTCTYECNDKILKYEAGSKEQNELSIVFNAEGLGRTKLYVDCVTNVPGEGIKVESKVFNISVD